MKMYYGIVGVAHVDTAAVTGGLDTKLFNFQIENGSRHDEICRLNACTSVRTRFCLLDDDLRNVKLRNMTDFYVNRKLHCDFCMNMKLNNQIRNSKVQI